MGRNVYIGFEPRETDAFIVAVSSTRRRAAYRIPIRGLELVALQEQGLYTRPTKWVDGQLFDVISDHPMATEFAISRFLTPLLARSGWALFMDCDMLVNTDIVRLFNLADPAYAVMCVKHKHTPASSVKMLGVSQSSYPRKNWSSVCLFNCDHPSNQKLTLEMVNSVPGRDLHAFCWLDDDEIGGLPSSYNFLVGYDTVEESNPPKIIHFTEGTPDMPGYENCQFSGMWRSELRKAVPYI